MSFVEVIVLIVCDDLVLELLTTDAQELPLMEVFEKLLTDSEVSLRSGSSCLS